MAAKIIAVIKRIRDGIHRAGLAAWIGLHEAEILGDWGAIEKRHCRLQNLEIKQSVRGWDA